MLSINILDGNTRCEGWVFIEENYRIILYFQLFYLNEIIVLDLNF